MIHRAGYIHNDIKPNNILVGQNSKADDQNKRVRLIDFGLVTKYKDAQGNHISEDSEIGVFSGNFLYANLDSLNGKYPSRKGEMISLGYCLLSLVGNYGKDLDA